MILQVDKTPPSLSQNSSEGYIGYRDLGPRPECGGCDTVDECGLCSGDQPFHFPVEVGDRLYFQFRFDDNFNEDPESPTDGWFSQSEASYFIKATIDFYDNTPDYVLNVADASEVIVAAYVGYYNGSFQNLVLNSTSIQEYIESQDSDVKCFRLLIQVYQSRPVDFTPVGAIFSGLPDHVVDGMIIAVENVQYTGVNGNWVATGNYNVGDVVRNLKNGSFYELQDDLTWELYDAENVISLQNECFTGWYQFVGCECPTVLIEGQHGESDCQGKYYGLPEGETVPYRDRYRLPAVLEPTAIRIEKEENDNEVVTAFKQFQVYKFLVQKPGLPWLVVQKLANSLYGAHFYIDSNEYINPPDEITKGLETGSMWYSQFNVERLACEKTNDCDDVVTYFPPIDCPDNDCPEFQPATVFVNDELYATLGSGGTVNIPCGGGPSGDDVLVTNSDDTYSESVTCGDELELPDQTIEFYLDGVLQDTETYPAMTNLTFDIVY